MTNPENVTADDTSSSTGSPPEAGGLPVEDVAPDVEVVEITTAEAEPDTGGTSGGTDSGAAAQDFDPDAAAPEPTD